MRTSIVIAAAALALAVSMPTAQAGCVQTKARLGGGAPVHRIARPTKIPALLTKDEQAATTPSDSIVGLWHVTHYDGEGNVYFEGFEQWHSDGTEFELANVPPAIGNICVGAWRAIGDHTYHLNHIGWDFTTDGDSDGVFTLKGTVKTSKGGKHFEGPSDIQIFDVNGNLVDEITGQMVGDRIPAK